MLGRPFGVPNQPDFQRRVLRALLSLFERSSGPVLEDYPEEAPKVDMPEGGFACPVSFASVMPEAAGLARALCDEIAQLAPWYDLAVRRRGRTTVGISGLTVVEAANHAASYLDGAPRPAAVPGLSAGIALKRACDDLKAYYYEAAAAQPGHLAPQAIDSWFWRETAAAKVFLAIREICRQSTDDSLRPLSSNGLIPRSVTDGTMAAQPDARQTHGA
jgi:hypothetical protein